MIKAVLLFILGLVFLIKGGDWFVYGAISLAQKLKIPEFIIGATVVSVGTIIARELGVPESVIGLTFVALGTSLPELVTAVTSLIKGHSNLSLGNIVGANLFNLVLVSGLSITLSPFQLPQSKLVGGINASLIIDIPVMLLVMCILTIP